MTSSNSVQIPPEQLHRAQDPATFEFECTEELTPLTEFIGQDRALRSIQFGLGVEKPGYNIFVTGLTGTGKATAILEHIQRTVQRHGETRRPDDWCYVYNFDDADRPNAIRLPAGKARELRDQLEELLTSVRANLTRAFSSEDYQHKRKAVLDQGQTEAEPLMDKAQRDAEAVGFLLRFAPTGIVLLPMVEGRAMTPDEFAALPEKERHEIEARQKPITDLVNETAERLRNVENRVTTELRLLDRQVAGDVVAGSFNALAKQYGSVKEVAHYLSQLREFTLATADLLRGAGAAPETQQPALPPGPPPGVGQPDPFVAFRCNVFVDNSANLGPPIIVEPNPNWTTLFGRVERRAYLGTYLSDHTMLKAGAIHRANGGYLILNLVDVLSKPGVWDGLRRIVRTKQISLEDPMEQAGFLTPQTLHPEPIAVDMKLVVTGDPMSYFLLSANDEEFWEMFKVKADFDYQIERTPENALAYAGFICACAQREGLRHFDRTAVARMVEHGSRIVDDQEKLSARFGRLRDIIVEADYWASQAGAERVSAEHVEQAINERVYRLNLIEERVRELIERGVIILDIAGSVAGQVNGLAVLDFGDYSFGRPARITARTFLGQRGITSIDRESQLSGRIHDKGVLILTGYLGDTYAQDRPLTLSASVSFEQGYDAIDGDSASLAELCAILSSLADAPIRQDLAVTGSVNQRGEVQPIGGLNQKIEGFHDVCRAVGFTGSQGVVIPSRNRHNLMLRKDVLESVEAGNFHVSAVASVDQAIELLTGIPAGERSDDGYYPDGTIHARVHARLDAMRDSMRRLGPRGTEVYREGKLEEPAQKQPPDIGGPRR